MSYQSYPYQGSSQGYPPTAGGGYYNAQPPYQAGPSQYHQSYPPPQPQPPQQQQQYTRDPFRSWYADRLVGLTFNSRPLIQELSITAMQQRDQNQWNNMTAVVEEIEASIYRSAPHEKLPKLYLLDSISKNVGPPFTTHLLPQTIPRIYIRTYREVDGVTKSKMEEMIALWRRSAPDGGELYGASVRETVEREIFGSTGVPHMGAGSAPLAPPPARDLPTRDRVLAAIHSTIQAKHAESAQRPWDQQVQTQLRALMGLSEMVNTRDVSTGELQQIMDQLRGMGYVQPQPQPHPSTPSIQAPQPYGVPGGYGGGTPLLGPPPQPQPGSMPPFPPSTGYAAPLADHASGPAPILPPFAPTLSTVPPPTATPDPRPSTPLYQQNHNTPPQPLAVPAPVPAALGGALSADVLSMLTSLAKAGPLGALGAGSADAAVATSVPVVKERTRLDDYEDLVLGLNLTLGNLDMNRMTALPIDHLPVRCSQCSARFSSSGKELNDHMDWHVRRNRQDRTSSGRGAHRRWLPKGDEWVNDLPMNGISSTMGSLGGLEAGAATGAGVTASGAAAALTLPGGKPLKTEEELRRRWVRVPTTPGAAGMVCPICKEGFKREWAEEEEEWVWRNAVDIGGGKIMHATCRQTQLVANRLARQSKGGRAGSTGTKSMSKSKSPGMTPELPTAGIKVEHPVHPLAHGVSMNSNMSAASSQGGATPVSGEDQGTVKDSGEDVLKNGESAAAGGAGQGGDADAVKIEEPAEQAVVLDVGEDAEGGGAAKRKASEEEGEDRKRAKVSEEQVLQEARVEVKAEPS